MSSYDDEIQVALQSLLLAGRLRDVGDSDPVFSRLSKAFPTSGSKIDWKRVPGAVVFTDQDEASQRQAFMRLFDEMRSRFELRGPATYAGDSATERALEGTLEAIRESLPVLLDVPQHHYIVGPDCLWCMCLTIEGDVSFGLGLLPSSA